MAKEEIMGIFPRIQCSALTNDDLVQTDQNKTRFLACYSIMVNLFFLKKTISKNEKTKTRQTINIVDLKVKSLYAKALKNIY